MESKNDIIDQSSKMKAKDNSESDTHENSQKGASNKKVKNKKMSVDFYPKKMEIDEIEKDIIKRRNTISMWGNIKNFVPQIKPIKIDIIPSKLRLNKMGFKDLKCNKNNKVLLYSNKYFISCPNIQDEVDDEEIDNMRIFNRINVNLSNELDNNINNNKNEDDMHQTRKKMLIMKNKNIPKVLSENNPHLRNKYNKELNIGYSSESDLDDINESLNDSINDNNDNEHKINIINDFDEDDNKKKRDRYNSWSILDILQKKNKME